MGFRPVTIPLLRGQDAGEADLSAVAQAQQLLSAVNVVFSKAGSIKGRPGTVSKDATLVSFDGSSNVTLAQALAQYQPAAIHPYAALGDSELLLQTHGRLYKRSPANWVDVGPVWSVRRDTWAALRQLPVDESAVLFHAVADVGPGPMGVRTFPDNQLGGFPVYAPDGTQIGPLVSPTHHTDTTNLSETSVANQMVVWAGHGADIGNLYAQIAGTWPAAPQFTLATDVTTVAATYDHVQRVWAAWDGTNYYVAYVTRSGTDSVKILKVSTGGSVLSSLSYTTASNVRSLSIAVDAASGKGLLVMTTDAATQVRTRVFNTSGMTDAAINVDISPVVSGSLGACAAIFGGKGWVVWNGDWGGLPIGRASTVEIYTRSMTAATSTARWQYARAVPGGVNTDYALQFQTLFPPQAVAGRLLLGLQVFSGQFGSGPRAANGNANGAIGWTWAVVDITDDQPAFPAVVAAGLAGSAVQATRAGSACTLADGSLLFGVAEGVSFNQFGAETVALYPVRLTPQGAPSALVDDEVLLGGNVTYVYDGRWCHELGFVEGAPALGGAGGGAGGSLQTGSYTFQAVWTYTDATGRVQRSVPSLPFTIAAVAGNVLTIDVTTPQLTTKFPNVNPVYVELYKTKVNPGGSAPLYLDARIGLTPSTPFPGQGSVTFTVINDTNTTSKELYTVGNILADERVPGDRGLVVLGNRVWSADEHHLYPSHATSTVVAPAWNQEQFFVNVPATFGRVVGLGSVDDTAVAVCENGVCTVDGPGFDDAGNGAGWTLPARVFDVGGAVGARKSAVFPGGTAYIGRDGLMYAVGRDKAGRALGKPVQTVAETAGDLVYVPPAANVGWDSVSNPMLVYGTANLKVLDLASGQWALWTGLTATALAGTVGGLCAMTTGAPYVSAFTASGGTDLGAAFTQTVKTAPQETGKDGLMHGWGRVRGMSPMFQPLAAHTLTVRAVADEGQVDLIGASGLGAVVSVPFVSDGKWPWDDLPEWRTTVQRAGFVEVTLSASPAAAEWTALELWVFGSDDRKPARRRVYAGAPTQTLDGPGVQRPVTQNDWRTLAGLGLRVPAYFYRCQDVAGDLTDEVQGAPFGTMTAGPGLSYGTTIAGWSQKFVSVAEVATGGAGRPAGARWNNYRQSVAMLLYARFNAAGGNRLFYTVNGGNRFVQFNGSGRLQLVDGNLGETITSTHNYLDGAVHPIYVECVAGLTIPGHTGPGVWRLTTDYEQFSGTWERLNDDGKGIGGAGLVGTSPSFDVGFDAEWIGTDAEAQTAVGPKTILQALGWTVLF